MSDVPAVVLNDGAHVPLEVHPYFANDEVRARPAAKVLPMCIEWRR
jgi:hypothetical protein